MMSNCSVSSCIPAPEGIAPRQVKDWVRKLEHLTNSSCGNLHSALTARESSFVEIQAALRKNIRTGTSNTPHFRRADVQAFVLGEIVSTGPVGSVITRGVVKMANQAELANEILEKSSEIVEAQLDRFNTTCDIAISEAKKRVSQLNDYQNRLATSLVNLNKILADDRLARALQNAERLSAALTLLDQLEANGSLERIMVAIGPNSAVSK